jgi:coenzyme F420-0:L-glutamate ligase/coenzyme F420-1:gamma-L-glutamate ligase
MQKGHIQKSSLRNSKKEGDKLRKNIPTISLKAIPNIPLIVKGDDLGAIIAQCAEKAGVVINDKDIIVVTSKIVSKAEGRLVPLGTVRPSEEAIKIAGISGKDPRVVELMIRESKVISAKPGVVETLHRLGFICTSGGVDRANTGEIAKEEASLLPVNPDESARKIRVSLNSMTGKKIGVIINDSLGIKYRAGSIGLAIGIAGIPAIIHGSDEEKDLYGKKRNVNISFADEIAAAASLLMGQSDAGLPVILIQGLRYPDVEGKFSDLIVAEQLKKDFS